MKSFTAFQETHWPRNKCPYVASFANYRNQYQTEEEFQAIVEICRTMFGPGGAVIHKRIPPKSWYWFYDWKKRLIYFKSENNRNLLSFTLRPTN